MIEGKITSLLLLETFSYTTLYANQNKNVNKYYYFN